MSLLTWRDEFSVNIANIDEQHKKFVQFINELYDARRNRTSREVMGQLIEELGAYAMVHFRTEELYFEMYEYPQAAEHKKEHEQLLSKLSGFKEKFSEGTDLFLAMNLADFLNTWLTDHIVKTDKRYSMFLNEKGLV